MIFDFVKNNMTSWRDEYLEALKECSANEKVSYELIDAYTRLADRTAALEAGKTATLQSEDPIVTPRESTVPSTTGDVAAQLRRDLAEALRSRGQLQSRLKLAEEDLETLRLKSKLDTKIIKDFAAERAVLVVKVKDRDEELRGKAKLLEDVQDEMISLNLQLNMAEQRSKKLQKENKDLIDRWMTRMGQEADAMNDASKFS